MTNVYGRIDRERPDPLATWGSARRSRRRSPDRPPARPGWPDPRDPPKHRRAPAPALGRFNSEREMIFTKLRAPFEIVGHKVVLQQEHGTILCHGAVDVRPAHNGRLQRPSRTRVDHCISPARVGDRRSYEASVFRMAPLGGNAIVGDAWVWRSCGSQPSRAMTNQGQASADIERDVPFCPFISRRDASSRSCSWRVAVAGWIPFEQLTCRSSSHVDLTIAPPGDAASRFSGPRRRLTADPTARHQNQYLRPPTARPMAPKMRKTTPTTRMTMPIV